MKILVIGATGPTGRELVAQARALGHAVTAGVRRPEAAGFPGDIRVVKMDVSDPASLAAAVDGQEAVVSSLGSKLSRRPTTLFSDGTTHLAAAMKGAGVRRLVCITGVGAGDSRGHGGFFYDRIFQPLFLAEIYKDKDRQEAIVRASGLDWTLVRPGMLTNGPKGGAIRSVTSLDGVTIGRISRADVAAYVLGCLGDPAASGKVFNISY